MSRGSQDVMQIMQNELIYKHITPLKKMKKKVAKIIVEQYLSR